MAEHSHWNELPTTLRMRYVAPRVGGLLLLGGIAAQSFSNFFKGPFGVLFGCVCPLAALAAAWEWPRRNFYRVLNARWEAWSGEDKCLVDVAIKQDGVLTGKDTALLCRMGNELHVEGVRANFVMRSDLVGTVYVPVKVGTDRYKAFQVGSDMIVGFKPFDRFPSFIEKRGVALSRCLSNWAREAIRTDGLQTLPPKEMQGEVLFTPPKVALRLALFLVVTWTFCLEVRKLPMPTWGNLWPAVSFDRFGHGTMHESAVKVWFEAFLAIGTCATFWTWLAFSWVQYRRQREFIAARSVADLVPSLPADDAISRLAAEHPQFDVAGGSAEERRLGETQQKDRAIR